MCDSDGDMARARGAAGGATRGPAGGEASGAAGDAARGRASGAPSGAASANQDELALFIAAVERYRSRPRRATTPEQTGLDLIRLRRALNLAELAFATLAAGFAATDQYDQNGTRLACLDDH